MGNKKIVYTTIGAAVKDGDSLWTDGLDGPRIWRDIESAKRSLGFTKYPGKLISVRITIEEVEGGE